MSPSFASILSNLKHLITRRGQDFLHLPALFACSQQPCCPEAIGPCKHSLLWWDHDPYNLAFSRLREAYTQRHNPLPDAVRQVILSKLLRLEAEADYLSKEVELNVFRVHFRSPKQRPVQELGEMRATFFHWSLVELASLEDWYKRFYAP